jgi:hypothetical protein
MEEFLNEVRAHSFFPPKFPSIQRRPKYLGIRQLEIQI